MLHYQSISQGPVVLLIHGLFGSYDNLSNVGKALSAQYRVISVDVRNHGRSFHLDNMDYAELVNDIVEVLDHENVENCHILGHSMGGKIAMEFALRYPERVNKLIVADIAPVTYSSHHDLIFKGLLNVDLANLNSRADADNQLAEYVPEPGVRQFLLKNLYRNEGDFAWRCNLSVLAEKYPQVLAGPTEGLSYDGETLFIKGGNSDYITAEHRPTIVSFFPNSKAKIINGAGHWLHAEKPIAFNKIVIDFLS